MKEIFLENYSILFNIHPFNSLHVKAGLKYFQCQFRREKNSNPLAESNGTTHPFIFRSIKTLEFDDVKKYVHSSKKFFPLR